MLLQVYVNGLKHCTFKHRIPLEKVSLIAINGDTTIQLIGFAEVSKTLFCFLKKFNVVPLINTFSIFLSIRTGVNKLK